MALDPGGGDNPGGMSQNLQAQMNASGGGRTIEPAKNFDELISQILEGVTRLGGMVLKVNPASLLNTGMFANAKLEEGAGFKIVNDTINKGAQSLTANGGVIARELAIAFQKWDFSNITSDMISAAMEAVQPMVDAGLISAATDISPAETMNLRPMDTEKIPERASGINI